MTAAPRKRAPAAPAPEAAPAPAPESEPAAPAESLAAGIDEFTSPDGEHEPEAPPAPPADAQPPDAAPAPVADGLVRLVAPATLASLSIDGVEYAARDGAIDVPADAVATAKTFGCHDGDPHG